MNSKDLSSEQHYWGGIRCPIDETISFQFRYPANHTPLIPHLGEIIIFPKAGAHKVTMVEHFYHVPTNVRAFHEIRVTVMPVEINNKQEPKV